VDWSGFFAREDINSSDFVKAKVDSTKPDKNGRQEITIRLKIPKGCYIYANPVGVQLLENDHTTVFVKGKTTTPSFVVYYPKGTKIKNDFIGNYSPTIAPQKSKNNPCTKIKNDFIGNYSVYQKRVTIKVIVSWKDNTPVPLEGHIFLKAVDQNLGIGYLSGKIPFEVRRK